MLKLRRQLTTATALALIATTGLTTPQVSAAPPTPTPAPGGSYDAAGTPLGHDSPITSMGFAPDGRLFVGGEGMAEVNPRTLTATVLDGVADPGFIGAVPASGTATRMYIGDSGDLLQFAEDVAWDHPTNPRSLLTLEGQDEVRVAANASTRIALGSAADGDGDLSIVDVRPGLERVIFRIAPFTGHDVNALQFVRDANNRAIMLGGTSADAGDAGLFAFQLASNPTDAHLRITEQPWEGIASVEEIVELPDGRVWALLADGSIHHLTLGDTLAGELSVSKVLDVFGAPIAAADGSLQVLDDRFVVGTIGGKVFTVDTETLAVSTIADGTNVAASPQGDGMFFFSDGAELFRYVPGDPSSDTSLASLTVEDSAVSLEAGVTEYAVDTVPSGSVPLVDAVARDYRAVVEVTQADAADGAATVVVTAASGATQTYTVQLVPMPTASDACHLVPPATLEVENLGIVQSELRLNTITVGHQDDRPVLYVQGGTPGDGVVVGIVDALTGELTGQTKIDELQQSLSPVNGPDGNIYLPGFPGDYAGTNLVRLNPETLEHESLGQALESETHITRMQLVGETIWMGTFPNAHIISYDIPSGEYTDHGRIAEDEWYARSIAHDGEHTIYAGTEGQARIVRWDLETGEKVDLPLPPTMSPGDYRISLMAYREGLLFAYFTASMDWHVYDPALGEWIASLPKNAPSMPTEVHPDTGRIYLANNVENQLFYFDFETREFGNEGWNQSLTYYTGGAGMELLDLRDPDWPGMSIVGMGRNGGIWRYNPITKYGEFDGDAELPMSTSTVRSLHIGPDGKTYTGLSFNRGTLARFNPENETFELQTPFAGSQIHRMFTASDGTMYFGGYTDALLLRYDPSEPYLWGENPREVARFGPEMQDRLFGIAESASGKIVAGGWGKRGHHHGVLAVYDPDTGDVQRYTDLLPGHQKIALLGMDDYVLGATSVATPGATPIEPEAKMYAFDPDTGEILWETVPIPGLQAVRSLVPRADGKVWAAGNDVTFLFDPKTKEVLQEVPVGAYDLEQGVDGFLYGSTSSARMWRMDPTSGDYQMFEERGRYLVQGPDGSLYWTDDTHIFRARLVHERESDAPILSVTTDPEDLSAPVDDVVRVTATATDASRTCVTVSRDGGEHWSQVDDTIEVTDEGETELLFRAVDVWGNHSDVETVAIRIDRAQDAPATTARYVGNNWIDLHLTAQGEDGVGETKYRLNDGDWTTYDEAIRLKRSDRQTVQYYSTSPDGTAEEIRCLTFAPGGGQVDVEVTAGEAVCGG